MGMSSYRMCKYLVTIAKQIDTEKLFPHKKTEGERLMAMLERLQAGSASAGL